MEEASNTTIELKCTSGTQPAGSSVRAHCEIVDQWFEIQFDVVTPGLPAFVNPDFGTEDSSWTLWEWDVVEVFVKANSRPTYYEVELSPIGQWLEVEVLQPRVQMNRSFRSGFERYVKKSKDGWTGRVRIPLKKLGWTGKIKDVTGGLFAILGPREARSYWAAFLPRQEKPDFHLPEQFQSFFVRIQP